jgi:hypothetical protein
MTKRELSKYDFEAIDKALVHCLKYEATYSDRLLELRQLFAKAHTGWLEIEED